MAEPGAVGVANRATRIANELASAIERCVERDELRPIDPTAQQALMSALCRLYGMQAAKREQVDVFGPQGSVSATDAMVLCCAALNSVDVQVFELALWQSWGEH